MAKVLLVGCGDLGTKVASLLLQGQHDVVGVRRSGKPISADVQCIKADVTDSSSLSPLMDVQPDILIYCVAANARTDESYRAHYVDGFKNVLLTQENNPQLKHVIFISSTRVYGQATAKPVDETVEALPSDFAGERLLEAEGLLKQLTCGTTVIRLSGIYGPGRLYMVNMAKEPNRWPETNKWTNRIHRDDAAAFITHLCEKVVANDGDLHDCYIGTDEQPVLQYEVLSWLASKLDVSVSSLLEPKASQVVSGKQLINKRMRATGFQFKYPSYRQGYDEILKSEVLNNG